jgi:hypothetical protein
MQNACKSSWFPEFSKVSQFPSKIGAKRLEKHLVFRVFKILFTLSFENWCKAPGKASGFPSFQNFNHNFLRRFVQSACKNSWFPEFSKF